MTSPEDPYRQAYGAVPPTEQFPAASGAYPAPAPYGSPPPPRGGTNPTVIVLLTVLTIAVIGGVAALVWILAVRDDTSAGSTQPATSVATVTESAVAPGGAAPGAVPAPAPIPAPAPVASLPASASRCGSVYGTLAGYGSSAVGSTVTSCPFAEEVRLAYAQIGPRGGSRLITAVSPTTGNVYDMNCVANTAVVTCAGGDNAVVYLY